MVRKDIMLNFDAMHFDWRPHTTRSPLASMRSTALSERADVADRMMTLKLAVKTIAAQYGLYATFMPKPMFGVNGSGMHVHQSLATADGENTFDDPAGKFGLSETCMKFLGGLLNHSQDNCAILASHVNSYKRLVPGYEAPCYISWANMNRSALIRVPAGRGGRARVELRNPDPAGNPYLQFAVMLASGMVAWRRTLSCPSQWRRTSTT